MNDTKAIEIKISEIETEMKRMNLWQSVPLPKSAYAIREAFGADTMTFAQWLQFILIPSVQDKLKTNGPWPTESEVGAYAHQPEVLTKQNSLTKVYPLIKLLEEFDQLFNVN